MTIEKAINQLKDMQSRCKNGYDAEAINIAIKAFEERVTDQWIPIKYRSLTTEEQKEFAEHYGSYYCDEIEKVFDCHMPEDGQEILLSSSWGVTKDIAEHDVGFDGFNIYGLEENGDWDGIDAWMPMPEPYKKGEEE